MAGSAGQMQTPPPKSWTQRADLGVLALALVILIAGAAGGPGWTDASHHAVLAAQLERAASAPLYGVLAQVAVQLPAGEPGFRLGVLGAVLGALVLVGVLRAARALLPHDPIAAALAPVLLVLAPPFRDAAGAAEPALLAACGAVWTLALAAEHARAPGAPRAVAAIAAAGVVVGAAPYLGVAFVAGVVAWLWRTTRRSLLALAVAGVGGVAVILWIGALGRLHPVAPDLHALVASSGRGAAAVVVGAGLLGAAFGAATGLPSARWLAGAIAATAGLTIVAPTAPVALLALLAIGATIIPAAVVRALPRRRHAVAAAAAVPLVLAAVLAGPALAVDDPADAPARLATDLTADLPAGPFVFVTTRPATFAALEYAQFVAGSRPDLRLVAPLAPEVLNLVIGTALHRGQLVASDTFAFDPRRAFPRGRAFQLLAAPPTTLAAIRPPARYPSQLGEAEAVTLALELARYEAGFGRLDAAAHAAGLTARFGAADLALLATSMPVHPALYPYIPAALGTPVGRWQLELLGDDLAWVAGLDVPAVDGPPARTLHALWRRLLVGELTADDPAIAALGPAAVAATRRLVDDLRPAPAPPEAASPDAPTAPPLPPDAGTAPPIPSDAGTAP